LATRPRWPKPKTQKSAVTPEVMAGLATNFYLIEIHDIIPRFLI
jgi:hypothetical protein